MNYLFVCLLTSLISIGGFANILIVEGKPYTVQPTELLSCGTEGDPKFAAAQFLISAAKGVGESTADAACKAGNKNLCSQDGKAKFWVGVMVQQTRKYPSRFSSIGCLKLRNYCETLCETSIVFSKDDCHIECNQYESYNK